MDNLDLFIQSTEGTQAGLTTSKGVGSMSYPFLYLTEITDVEIAHLVEANVLTQESLGAEYMPLYLKSSAYRLLGYVNLCFSTVIQLNYLREHKVFLKASKESEMCITESLFESLLLSK